jgi:hypothetical protein
MKTRKEGVSEVGGVGKVPNKIFFDPLPTFLFSGVGLANPAIAFVSGSATPPSTLFHAPPASPD